MAELILVQPIVMYDEVFPASGAPIAFKPFHFDAQVAPYFQATTSGGILIDLGMQASHDGVTWDFIDVVVGGSSIASAINGAAVPTTFIGEIWSSAPVIAHWYRWVRSSNVVQTGRITILAQPRST